jgi:hypothetical protein
MPSGIAIQLRLLKMALDSVIKDAKSLAKSAGFTCVSHSSTPSSARIRDTMFQTINTLFLLCECKPRPLRSAGA